MSRTNSNFFSRGGEALLALAALMVMGGEIRAQDMPSRFLFIFDTSADMKNRIKAEQLEINQVLVTSMGGQLQDGDSVGVWTFDQTLHAGQFPLVTWSPENAHSIADGINTFVRKQHYSQGTSFAALQPVLNEVVKDSPRLTVLIFCDGEDNIGWTPYNDGINRIFAERRDAQKKGKQPFILVMRLQLGQFVGCTMNFPPGMLNVPDFPPLPPPPQPAPVAAAPVPAPAPLVAPTPLIIVGTNIMDHEPSLEAIPPSRTSPPPPVVVMVTNVVTQTNTVASTNAVAPPGNALDNHKVALVFGAGFLIAAIGLITLAVSRNRGGDRSSLITRSMRKD